jgi:hypothetical protein
MPSRFLLILALAASLAVCSGDTRFLDPDDGNGGDNGGGDLRADLTVQVGLAEPDAEIASLLGWPVGAVVEAEVVVRRLGQTDAVTLVSDSSGLAIFPELLVGSYSVLVRRAFTPAEEDELRVSGGEHSDVDVLGGGATIALSAPGREVELEARAGRRGSLVISELNRSTPFSESDIYRGAHYIEFYNNSDSTIYLDGKIVGFGMILLESESYPCESLESWRLDPDFLWSRLHMRFPGHGTQFPLGPGGVAILAKRAIDHSEFWPGTPDLSAADFESVGANDVDNPSVPNMIDVGLSRWDDAQGHGMLLGFGIYFIAEESNVEELAVDDLPTPGGMHRGFPVSSVLDILPLLRYPHPDAAQHCAQVIHPTLDRAPLQSPPPGEIQSSRRRVLTTLAGGRVILQRTRTSALDFEHGTLTPGVVP